MAKSLKSLLSKINLVDVAVVLVLIAVLMCLMKKMNVVEGLCVAGKVGMTAADSTFHLTYAQRMDVVGNLLNNARNGAVQNT